MWYQKDITLFDTYEYEYKTYIVSSVDMKSVGAASDWWLAFEEQL